MDYIINAIKLEFENWVQENTDTGSLSSSIFCMPCSNGDSEQSKIIKSLWSKLISNEIILDES